MRVLILGSGVGGQVISNRLGKRLGGKHEVVLVDKKPVYEFPPSFTWIMDGSREPHQITRNLNVLEKKGIRWANSEVLDIDPAERKVKTAAEDIGYDKLVVALGAELSPQTIPGFSGTAHHVYTLQAALALREQLKGFSGGRVAVGVSSLPFKCPAAPYEAALLMDHMFRKKGVREKTDIQFFTAEGRPMGVAPPEVGELVKGALENRGISYHPGTKLASVDSEKGEIGFEDGDSMGFDLLFAVPPHKPPEAVRESPLANETGWISVDRRTLATDYDDVYAVGDITSIKLHNGKMLPKAGVFAHGQAETVSRSIASEIAGNAEKSRWSGDGSCFIETGFGKAGMAKGNFYAEPDPEVKIRWPSNSRMWHWYKILFEKYWLWKWF
jgi:sulfide:quinone oxidoreductase